MIKHVMKHTTHALTLLMFTIFYCHIAIASPELNINKNLNAPLNVNSISSVTTDVAENINHIAEIREIRGISKINKISKLSERNANKIAKSYRGNGEVIEGNYRVETSIKSNFEKYHFKQQFSAVLTDFNQATNFKLARFDGDALFQSTKFRALTSFSWVQFNGAANFSHSRFYAPVEFYRSSFNHNNASFYGSHFNDTTDFSGSNWQGNVDFSNITAADTFSFYASDFKEAASFYNSQFNQSIDFSHVSFKKSVDFSRAIFNTSLDFSDAKFLGKVNFHSTKLPIKLNFSGVDEIDQLIDLTKANPPSFGKKVAINLLDANISKIKIDYQYFILDFPINTEHNEILSVYASLLNDFQNRGMFEDYKKLSIEQKRYIFEKNDQWLMNIIEQYWWDYGFDRGRIFIWIIIFILLYTAINNFFVIWLMENAYSVTFLQPVCSRMPSHKNILVRYVLSLPLALIYTVVIFFGGILGFKREFAHFRSVHVLINTYIFFTMATGLICAMFILNYLIK